MSRDELLTKLAMELEEWPRVGCPHDELPPLPTNWRWKESPSSGTPMVFPENNGKPIRAMHYLQRRTELINRPSWDDAPEEALFLSQEPNGEWGFWMKKPELALLSDGYDEESWTGSDPCWEFNRMNIRLLSGSIPAGHDWRDTLEPRPQAQSDIKTCRHCDIEFRRPHVDGIPDDRCTRCDDEIKALWPEHETVKTWWTSKTCTKCGHTTAAKVSDDNPVCPGCVAMGCDDYDEDSDEESTLSQAMDEQMRAAAEKWARGDMEARSKYHREIKPGVWVDVYDVLRAWDVKNPALQHLIKKAMAPGERGHKTLEQDMADIVASAKRAKEMEE